MWKRPPEEQPHGHANVNPKAKAETGDDRQRHGRRAHARRAAEDRARPVRHHGLRRRAAPQLQPHPAVAGAGRRADAGRDRAERLGLVHRQPASPCTPAGRSPRWTACSRVVHAENAAGETISAEYDRLLHAHRLQPVHPADSRQGSGRRDRLPRHRRHQRHDRGQPRSTSARWSSAAACSAWKPPTA